MKDRVSCSEGRCGEDRPFNVIFHTLRFNSGLILFDVVTFVVTIVIAIAQKKGPNHYLLQTYLFLAI